jgi:hypothetical protein
MSVPVQKPARPILPSFSSVSPALSTETLSAVNALGFQHMTPVQAATIPLFLRNKVSAANSHSEHVLITFRTFVWKHVRVPGKPLRFLFLCLRY